MSGDTSIKDDPLPPVAENADTEAAVTSLPDPAAVPAPDTSSDAAGAATPPPAPAQKGGGLGRFVGMMGGGIVAAGLGFGLATYGVQQGWPLLVPPQADTVAPADLAADLAALRDEVDRIAKAQPIPAQPVDLAPLEARLAALEAAPDAAASPDLGALAARVAALEQRPVATSPADPAAISAQIEAELATRLQAVEAEADRLRAEAAATQAKARQRAALVTLQGAMASGLALPQALAATEGLALPAEITAWAKAPQTLQDLRDSFAPAARDALAAVRSAEQAQGAVTDRLATFLMNQTGARSTTAREGDDPDAVLSRMEAAVAAGDLAAALALAPALPEAAQPALADWLRHAQALLAAQTALAALIPAE